MKRFKLLILGIAILIGGNLSAQETTIKEELKKKGDLIEATYYYENGQIAQKGFFKNGKLHGEWVAYDQKGNKNAIGEYTEGLKTGKWFFWHENILTEVDFEQSRIASVNKWQNKNGLVSK